MTQRKAANPFDVEDLGAATVPWTSSYRLKSRSIDQDFLIMLPFFMDAAVVGTEATTFEVSLRPRRAEPGQPRPARTQPDLTEMLAIRRQFLTIAQTFVDDRVPPGPGRALWAALLWRYADRRVYKTRHIVRRSARRLIGLKP